MPSITSIFGLLEKMENAPIAVNRNRCVMVRNRNAGCMRCAQACTAGCISLEDGDMVVSPEKCIGCGTCASACPTGALEVKNPSDVELYNRVFASAQAAGGEAIVVCKRMLDAANGLYDPEKVTGVVCLGGVDESLLLSLATVGGVGKITLVHAKCAECAYASGREMADVACDTANVLLETWGSPVRACVSAKLPGKTRLTQAAEYDQSRREFFTDFKDSAKNVAAVSADYAVKETLGLGEEPETPRYAKVDERGVLPQEFPERRKRLLDALDELGEPAEAELTTRLWGSIDIDTERCTSCRMCATFCPTGAIFKFSTKKGKIGVKHRVRQCVNCGCCENICRTGALSLSSTVPAVRIMSAEVSRFVLPPLENPPSNPQSILKSMKRIINCDQVYER